MEHKTNKLLCLTVCFLVVGMLNGFPEPPQKSFWKIGIENSHITYKEPGVMKEKGFMYGIVGSCTYHEDILFKAEGRYSYGTVDYTGATQDGTPLSITNIKDYMWEFRALMGCDLPSATGGGVAPYFGIGLRYLNDDLSETPGGYERESQYTYIPLGIEIETFTDTKNRAWIGATLEYDLFIGGRQTSHMTDVGYDNDVVNNQHKGYGYRGTLKIHRGDFVIAPFIRYWNIEDSNKKGLFLGGVYQEKWYEPKNNSTEIGISIEVRF